MAQPKLKNRPVNRRVIQVDEPKPRHYFMTEAMSKQARAHTRRAINTNASIAGIKRTGGFGIA